jgi:hypothetical protein
MVGSEWGFAGLISFVGIFGSTFVMLRRVKREAGDDSFYFYRATALQCALIASLIAATFTDRLYGEAMYWMTGLSYALYRMQRTDQQEQLTAATTAIASANAATGAAEPAYMAHGR